MLIDAKDKFIQRMAATMVAIKGTATPEEMKERFGRFDPLDKAKALSLSLKASAA